MIRKISLLLAMLLASSPVLSDDYTRTRYPIVLAHGMYGFDNIAFINYWYGIPNSLRKSGAEVFVTQVSALNSSETRGEQLLSQVEEILAITGSEKVNLIGHSHGGHSIRYVAAMMPDHVASVTTVGSPVKGSSVADVMNPLPGVPVLGGVVESVMNGLGMLIGLAAGESLPQDIVMSLGSLTSEGTSDFNNRFPAGVPETPCGEGQYQIDGTHYFSWSGVYAGVTHFLDPTSYALLLTRLAFDEPNDGLVGRCSSHFGQVLRDNYLMDHLDEVNQILGLVHIFASNPKTVYRQHANRLQNLGL